MVPQQASYTKYYIHTCRPLVQVYLFSRVSSLRVFIPYSIKFQNYACLNLPLLTLFRPSLPTLFIPPIREMGSIHGQPPPPASICYIMHIHQTLSPHPACLHVPVTLSLLYNR